MVRLGQLERIRLEGFLSIRKMDLELRPLNLPIGPNGAGKSNLIKFFRLMNAFLLQDLQIHVRQTGKPEYRQIVETVQRVAPMFHDFILEPEGASAKTIRLRWKHRGIDTPFDVSQLSDGTLRFICLATLLLQPEPPKVIVLDEPELGLHPYAIQLLAAMMRSAAARTRIVAATQSVTLANQFGPEDLIVVETRDNASHFERLSTDGLAQWLDEYRMGDLWEKNLIGGNPE